MSSESRFQGATFDDWMLELEYTPRNAHSAVDQELAAAFAELRPSQALFEWLADQAKTAIDFLRVAQYADDTGEELQVVVERCMLNSLRLGFRDKDGWTLEDWTETLGDLRCLSDAQRSGLTHQAMLLEASG